jgi:hypothetical protein
MRFAKRWADDWKLHKELLASAERKLEAANLRNAHLVHGMEHVIALVDRQAADLAPGKVHSAVSRRLRKAMFAIAKVARKSLGK